MDRLGFWIYRFLGFAVRPFPLAAIFRAGQALGLFGYYVAGPYRRLALHNLTIAFGEEKDAAELRRLCRRHFRNLVANLLCSLKIATLSREQVRSIVTVENLETLHAVLEEKSSYVALVSHIGNWELLAQILPVLCPAPVGTVYQRLGNRYIDADVRSMRQRRGLQLFERKEGFQGAIKALRGGRSIGVLMDQHAGDKGIWCSFFGRLASTAPFGATLALRGNRDILPVTIFTDVPGRWRVVFSAPIRSQGQSIERLTGEINQALETLIRRQPEDWFWVHNRWKTPSPKFLLSTYKRGIFLGEKSPEALKPFRILIRSTNWLGDAVMSVPAVRAIKSGRPDARVSVLCPAKLADVWKTVAEVDEVIAIEPKDGVLGVARKIRGRFDVEILFPNSVRSALEGWLAGIPRRAGYPGHRRRWLLNQVFREKKSKKPRPVEHQVHHYLRLAQFVGADLSDVSATTLGNGAKPPRPQGNSLRLALCPGAEYGPAKRWLPERYAEVMSRISATHACEWVLVGVAKDAPIGEEITRQYSGAARNLIGKTTLTELIEELRACDLLLTNDTGTMHLAALLKVPVVAIFGSTEPALTGPLGEGHRIVRNHVACSPCFLRECPIDFRCMQKVSSDEVVAAVEETIRERLGQSEAAG